MTLSPLFKIRLANDDDIHLVINSWLHSYRASPFGAGMSSEVYYREHRDVLQDILEHCQVMVACDNEIGDQIYGWIAYEESKEETIVHFVYVKRPFRKFGIASTLVEGIPTHKPWVLTTKPFYVQGSNDQVPKKLRDVLEFNPYLILKKKNQRSLYESKVRTVQPPRSREKQ